jgi:hypothetical protein
VSGGGDNPPLPGEALGEDAEEILDELGKVMVPLLTIFVREMAKDPKDLCIVGSVQMLAGPNVTVILKCDDFAGEGSSAAIRA